jgi:two-component system NarL family sensor kinase
MEFFRGFAEACLDDLLASLRGEPLLPISGPEPERGIPGVQPGDLLIAAVLLYDIAVPVLLTALLEAGTDMAAVAHQLSVLHRVLSARAMMIHRRYADNLLERARNAELEERTRIAREIRENVTTGVSTAFRDFSQFSAERADRPEPALARLREAIAGIESTLGTIRDINSRLRTQLAGESLETVLRNHLAALGQDGPAVQILVTGDESWIRPELRDPFYLTCCEAAHLAMHNAAPTSVHVNVHLTPNLARCTVIDDGTGPGQMGTTALQSLRERVELLGGDLHVDPRPGGGTRMTFVISQTGATDVTDH